MTPHGSAPTARRRAPRRILLVSPGFHGYWQALAAGLAAHDVEVITHCYDAGGSRVHALGNAVAYRVPVPELRRRVDREWTSRAVATLRQARPDAVLVVKGDRLGQPWWDALAAARIPYALWLYDELVNMSYRTEFLAELDRVYSYSSADVDALQAAGVAAGFLANAFDSSLAYQPRSVPAVTFVGARYPEREQLLRAVAQRGIPVIAYGREWSRHPWDVARTRQWRSAGISTRRDLPRSDYYAVMAGSTATLNIHGAGHHGLSMRTFEAPGVGALSLVDRPSVAQFYEPGKETLLFEGADELVDLLARADREPQWADAIRAAGAARTLADHTFVRRMATVLDDWRQRWTS